MTTLLTGGGGGAQYVFFFTMGYDIDISGIFHPRNVSRLWVWSMATSPAETFSLTTKDKSKSQISVSAHMVIRGYLVPESISVRNSVDVH